MKVYVFYVVAAMLTTSYKCQTSSPVMTTRTAATTTTKPTTTTTPATTPTTTPTTTTTTLRPVENETGFVITMDGWRKGEHAMVRHFPFIPGYEEEISTVPGLAFTNEDIWLLSVDVDLRRRQVFFYDHYLGSILAGYNYNADYKTLDNMVFKYFHFGVSKGSIQITVDYITNTLYIADGLFKWIIAAPTSEAVIEKGLYKVIANTNLDEPDGLAVDPVNKYLFWSDTGKHPKIERSNLDGTERHTLIKDGLNIPISLETDIPEKRIYWIDSYSETIESADYNGMNRKIVKRIATTSLFDTAIYKDLLAVTDIYNDDVYFLNKTTGKEASRPFSVRDETPYSIVTYNLDNQPLGTDNDPDPCARLNCSHLCINTASAGPQCHCADGYKYNTTINACIEDSFLKALLMANDTHICFLDIRAIAFNNYNILCKFTVIVQPPTTTAATTDRPQATTQAPAGSNISTSKPTTTQAPPTTTIPAPTAAPGDTIKMFDIDMANRILYYVSADNAVSKRLLDLPITDPAKEILVRANGNVTGLAFDWIGASTIYWCESDTNSIHGFEVGNRRQWVVTREANNPRGLALLPHQRKLLYTSSTTEEDSSLMEIDLVGGKPSLLAAEEDVNGRIGVLAVDQHNQTIYWIKEIADKVDKVYKLHYDDASSKPMLVRNSFDEEINDLIHYNNYLVWSYGVQDNDHSEIQAFDLKRNRLRDYAPIDENMLIKNMKVLDVSLQPRERSECSNMNGGCDHICMATYANGKPYAECKCSFGYKITNRTKCTSNVVMDNFIMVADWTNDELLQISLDKPDYTVRSLSALQPGETPISVVYDQTKNRIMWTELGEKYVVNYDMQTKAITKTYTEGNYWLDQLALDESSGNMYVSDQYESVILVLSELGVTTQLISFDNYFDTPGGITLDPRNGYMYFTLDSYFDNSYVGRADMDGKNIVKLIAGNEDGDISPGSIVLDSNNNRLFWVDTASDTNHIQKCTLFNNTCIDVTVVHDGSSDESRIAGLSIDEEYLYYTALNHHFITRISLTDLTTSDKIAQHYQLGRLESLAVYRSGKMIAQPPTEVCSERGGRGQCSTLCIPSPGGYTCACENDDEIGDDQKTCPGVFTCPDYVSQPSTFDPNQEVRIPIVDDCNGFVGDDCTFRCPKGWRPSNSSLTAVTCNPTGWGAKDITWDETFQLCVEIQCPVLTFGTLQTGCSRLIGSQCDFNCPNGKRSDDTKLACTAEGTWNKNVKTICQEIKCDKTIKNGQVDTACTATPSKTCKVSCQHGFKTDTAQITCGDSGNWNFDTNTICKAVMCQVVTNGNLIGCTNNIGEQCQYSCNNGFKKAVSVDKIICMKDGAWYAHGKAPCTAICENDQFTCKTGECIASTKFCDETHDCPDKSDEINCNSTCQDTFFNGTGNPKTECSLEVGSVCEAVCKTGYKSITKMVVCNNEKKWYPEDVCQDIKLIPSQTDALTKTKPSTSNAGLSAGVAILAVGVVVLVIVIVFLFRRHRNNTSYSASYSNGAMTNVAIENPGYNNSIRVKKDKGESNYDVIDPSQVEMQATRADFGMVNSGIPISRDSRNVSHNMYLPSQEDTTGQENVSPQLHSDYDDAGIVNPMYSQQHGELHDVATIEVNNDNTVLTNDSWLKDQAKGPDTDQF